MSLVSPGVSGVGSQVDTKAGLKAGLEFESLLRAWCLVCTWRRGGTQSLLTEKINELTEELTKESGATPVELSVGRENRTSA